MPLSKLVLIQDNFWLKSGKGFVVEKAVLLPLKLLLKKVSLSPSFVSPTSCPPHASLPSAEKPNVCSAGYKHTESSASKPLINSHHP